MLVNIEVGIGNDDTIVCVVLRSVLRFWMGPHMRPHPCHACGFHSTTHACCVRAQLATLTSFSRTLMQVGSDNEHPVAR